MAYRAHISSSSQQEFVARFGLRIWKTQIEKLWERDVQQQEESANTVFVPLDMFKIFGLFFSTPLRI